jgi:protein Tex
MEDIILDIIKFVAEELKINKNQVENTVNLLDEGATIPFISRYRKEVTGNLNEEQIRDISEKVTYVRNLEKRKEEVLSSIEEQGKLTDELRAEIEKSVKLQEVEDLYLPYKKKKKTKADIAKENGLEPLALFILSTESTIENIKVKAKEFINETVADESAAIDGAKLIIAQNLSEEIKIREYLRAKLLDKGILTSKVIEKNLEKDSEKQVYKDYYTYEEEVKKAASHRVMALNRGEHEDILRVNVKLDDKTYNEVVMWMGAGFENKNIKEFNKEIVTDSLDRLIYPSIEREIRNILTEKAEEEAIKVFGKNLKSLLLQPPIYGKSIIGLDPGYRTGCKVVVINSNGFYETGDVIYITHSEERMNQGKEFIKSLIEKYSIDIIAIGNGTASRETEKFTADLIKEMKSSKKLSYLIVNEAGASIYSASKLAKEEFPDLDVTARGAISIARRVQDPLAELVKIDPESIGVGMYQHDINQTRLKDALTEVVESAVNSVGINVNSASWALLGYVSGINKTVAKNIVEYRNQNGNFKSRAELKKVKGLGDKAFMLAAGFIVVPESKNPLDNTIIHPESYDIAEKIVEAAGSSVKELKTNIDSVREKVKNIDIAKVIKENEFGEETAKDIFAALMKERRDPRESMPQPLLKDDILDIKDLKTGMELEGTVRNVIAFGAFVDIGLKNDALLHVSELDKFVKDPTTVFSVGQILKVKVKGVELDRGRVSLTMKGM